MSLSALCVQIRGATNAVMKLVKEAAECGRDTPVFVTQSSGNHAQALALAAKLCGVRAEIVMPRTSPSVKVRAVEGYGGVVTLCEPSEKVSGFSQDCNFIKQTSLS